MKRRRLRSWLLVVGLMAAALAIVAMAGCGGDDDDVTAGGGAAAQESSQTRGEADGGDAGKGGGDGATPPDAKAQFIAEADAICRKAEARTTREFNELQNTARNEIEAFRDVTMKVIVPRIEDRVRGIRSLETPPEAEQAAETVIKGFEELIETAKADPIGFQSKAGEALVPFQEAVSREGFDDCAGYLG